jgi:hypothetical protein
MHLRDELIVMMRDESMIQRHSRIPSMESNSGYSDTSESSGSHNLSDEVLSDEDAD